MADQRCSNCGALLAEGSFYCGQCGRGLSGSRPERLGSTGSQLLLYLLVGIAFIGLVAGLGYLTEMTLGIGLIAAGCLFGILARIHQAAIQHDERMQMLQHQD